MTTPPETPRPNLSYAVRLTRADLAFISECVAQNGNDRSAAEEQTLGKINRVLMKADRAEGKVRHEC